MEKHNRGGSKKSVKAAVSRFGEGSAEPGGLKVKKKKKSELVNGSVGWRE